MTREEEKLKAADEYVKNRIKEGQGRTGDVFPVFIEGIEWADANPERNTFACISLISADKTRKQMIDKAVKWLESVNLDFYQIREGVFSRQLVEDFKKYIEE